MRRLLLTLALFVSCWNLSASLGASYPAIVAGGDSCAFGQEPMVVETRQPNGPKHAVQGKQWTSVVAANVVVGATSNQFINLQTPQIFVSAHQVLRVYLAFVRLQANAPFALVTPGVSLGVDLAAANQPGATPLTVAFGDLNNPSFNPIAAGNNFTGYYLDSNFGLQLGVFGGGVKDEIIEIDLDSVLPQWGFGAGALVPAAPASFTFAARTMVINDSAAAVTVLAPALAVYYSLTLD